MRSVNSYVLWICFLAGEKFRVVDLVTRFGPIRELFAAEVDMKYECVVDLIAKVWTR